MDSVFEATKNCKDNEAITDWWMSQIMAPPAQPNVLILPPSQSQRDPDAMRVEADRDGVYRFAPPPAVGGAAARRRKREFRFPNSGASSAVAPVALSAGEPTSSGGALAVAPGVVKSELLDDEALARIIAAQEDMAAGGVIPIEASPVLPRSVKREPDFDGEAHGSALDPLGPIDLTTCTTPPRPKRTKPAEPAESVGGLELVSAGGLSVGEWELEEAVNEALDDLIAEGLAEDAAMGFGIPAGEEEIDLDD